MRVRGTPAPLKSAALAQPQSQGRARPRQRALSSASPAAPGVKTSVGRPPAVRAAPRPPRGRTAPGEGAPDRAGRDGRAGGERGEPPAWIRAQQQPLPPPARPAPGTAAGRAGPSSTSRTPASVWRTDRPAAERNRRAVAGWWGGALPGRRGRSHADRAPGAEGWARPTAALAAWGPTPAARLPGLLSPPAQGIKARRHSGPRGLSSAGAPWLRGRPLEVRLE